MAVWTGWGVVVPLSVIVSLFLSFLTLALLGYSADTAAWAGILAAGLVSGPVIHRFARRADAIPGGLGEGSFFFLRTRRWAFIVPAMMALMALGSRAPGGLAG
jgi:hypothetical protein